MTSFLETAREILCRDLDPDFVEAAVMALPWEYSVLFEEVAAKDGLNDECRREEFNKRRGDCVRNALARVAKSHGVPFELRRLSVNGQHKIIIRAGRVILIQETIEAFLDRPEVADYKIDLATAHGFVRQLELDLGDRVLPAQDWSGCILAVILHGQTSTHFTRDGMMSRNLILGVPDAAYESWVLRLDLHDLAMFGRRGVEIIERSPSFNETVGQEDEVIVKPKRRNRFRDTA